MDKLLELLFRQPLILLLVGAWAVGMITNVLKAQKKAREEREAATRPTPMPTTRATTATPAAKQKAGDVVAGLGTGQQGRLPQQRQAPASMRGAQPTTPPVQSQARPRGATSPDEIAAEMRRIFGLESPPQAAPPPVRPKPVTAQDVPELVDPRSVRVRSSEPRLKTHVQSHVGEQARDRHMKKSQVGQTRGSRGMIGNLGGRVKKAKKKVSAERRYPMSELRRFIVMNEILSPPVTLRDSDQTRLF